MLQTLTDYQPREALGILSKLTHQLSPEPSLEREVPSIEKVDFKSENVINEIRERLNLAPHDFSDKARDKILGFISDQISEIVLTRKNRESIRDRLGDKGLLRPDLYTVTFPSNFDNDIGGRGIRRSHVQQAFNYPDEFEHVLPEDMPFKGDSSVSLYVKQHNIYDVDNGFFLLVVSLRKGHIQEVIDAFRIYPSDVKIGFLPQPLDLLRSVVEKYGLVFKVGDQQRKFFFLVVIENSKSSDVVLAEWHPPAGIKRWQQSMMIRNTGETSEISIAYLINEDAYRADLKKHGVQVSL